MAALAVADAVVVVVGGGCLVGFAVVGDDDDACSHSQSSSWLRVETHLVLMAVSVEPVTVPAVVVVAVVTPGLWTVLDPVPVPHFRSVRRSLLLLPLPRPPIHRDCVSH